MKGSDPGALLACSQLPHSFIETWALASFVSSLVKWMNCSLKHYLNWLLEQQAFKSQTLGPHGPELES